MALPVPLLLLLLLLVVVVRLILGVAIVTAFAVNIVVVSAVAAIIFNDGRLGSTVIVGISVIVVVFENFRSSA